MNFHALLIGIQHYEPNELCDSLEGPVADVEAIERFLSLQDLGHQQVHKLISVPPEDGHSEKPRERRPTYENIVEAFQRILREAKNGEQVLVYYSGHGGQTPTLIPDSKGKRGLDEGLVPCNVGDPRARYLRDIELSHLVHEMVDAGLIVTLIIDACHSGGMTRKAKLVPRSCRIVDKTKRPPESLVASIEDLEKAWRRNQTRAYVTTRGASRDRRSASGWLPPNDGVVVLAACRSFETAYEYPFYGQPRGVLTHCLLEILGDGSAGLSFQQIHHRLISRVHRFAPAQIPVLEGESSRLILGGRLRGMPHDIIVLETDPSQKRALLNVGQALGLCDGALLRTLQENDGEAVSGSIVEINELGAVNSWACVQESEAQMPEIRPGDRAILIDPGDQRLRRRVALVRPRLDSGERPRSWWQRMFPQVPGDSRLPDLDTDVPRLLDAIEQELSERSSGFLESTEDAGDADYQVAVNPRGEYEIWHSDGQTVADLPSLPTTGEGAPERTVDRLIHLTKFHNILRLENNDPKAPDLTAEIGLLPRDYVPGDAPEPLAFDAQGSIPRVKKDSWICLSITNPSRRQLHIYVFDLQPGWSIEQIHPQSELETLEGEQQLRLPFEIYLPRNFENRRETLKVFATAEPTDFRWLTLEPIDRSPRAARSGLGRPRDPLEQLFAEIVREGPPTRDGRTSHAKRHWATVQVEFEVIT